jgi:hypothetical protein
MTKAYFEMTPQEQKEALAQERRDKEAFFKDLIDNAPKRQAEEDEAKRVEAEIQAADKEVAFKQTVLESYIAANGSEWGFEAQWPELRAEIVKQKTLLNVGNVVVTGDVVDRFIARMNAR